MSSPVILSIESAIEGGSVALLRDGTVQKKWNSPASLARSEEILLHISNLIREAGTDKADLTLISVSNGPGSYTGIRVGLATAMGLAYSLNIPCVGISALKAIALENGTERRLVVLPIGRDGCCWQLFESESHAHPPLTGSLEEFISRTSIERRSLRVLAHGSLVPRMIDLGYTENVIDTGRDVAVAIGHASFASIDDGLTPFYARDNPVWESGAPL